MFVSSQLKYIFKPVYFCANENDAKVGRYPGIQEKEGHRAKSWSRWDGMSMDCLSLVTKEKAKCLGPKARKLADLVEIVKDVFSWLCLSSWLESRSWAEREGRADAEISWNDRRCELVFFVIRRVNSVGQWDRTARCDDGWQPCGWCETALMVGGLYPHSVAQMQRQRWPEIDLIRFCQESTGQRSKELRIYAKHCLWLQHCKAWWERKEDHGVGVITLSKEINPGDTSWLCDSTGQRSLHSWSCEL